MVGDKEKSGNGSTTTALSLSVYDRIQSPESAIKSMGMAIAASQMFGCESVHQGEVLALECMVRRCSPLSLATRYHIIGGKLSMKADEMLSEFRTRGGKHRVIDNTAERAAVLLILAGEERMFELTWEQASNEPFVYQGKEKDILPALLAGKKSTLSLKAKYATPRSRKQMLWARVISEGVRVMCPEVNSGQYTPEEVSDFTGVELSEDPNVIEAEFTVVPVSEAVADQPGVGGATTETVVTTNLADAVTDNATPIVTDGVAGVQYATSDQLETFELLIAQLNVTPTDRDKILQKRSVNSPRSLTVDQIREINTTLSNKIQKIQDQKSEEEKRKEREAIQAVEANHAQRLSESEQQAAEMSVVSDDLEAAVKAELQKLKQVQQAEYAAIINLIKAATPSGKIKGMSTRNAKEMLQHMQAGTAAKFIAKYTGESKLDGDPIPF